MCTIKTLYRDRGHEVEFLLHMEDQQQIIQKNVETQHKHMSLTGCLPNDI